MLVILAVLDITRSIEYDAQNITNEYSVITCADTDNSKMYIFIPFGSDKSILMGVDTVNDIAAWQYMPYAMNEGIGVYAAASKDNKHTYKIEPMDIKLAAKELSKIFE